MDVPAANAMLERNSHDSVWGVPLNAGPPWSQVRQEMGSPGDLIEQGFDTSAPIIQLQAERNSFVKIDVLTCLRHYTSLFGNQSDVLLVSSESSGQSNNSFLAAGWFNPGPAIPEIIGYWMCGKSNNFSCRDKDDWERNSSLIADWNVYGYKIDYCLEKQVSLDDSCSVHFSPAIMIGKLALACTLSKITLMLVRRLCCKFLQTYGNHLHCRILRKKQ